MRSRDDLARLHSGSHTRPTRVLLQDTLFRRALSSERPKPLIVEITFGKATNRFADLLIRIKSLDSNDPQDSDKRLIQKKTAHFLKKSFDHQNWMFTPVAV